MLVRMQMLRTVLVIVAVDAKTKVHSRIIRLGHPADGATMDCVPAAGLTFERCGSRNPSDMEQIGDCEKDDVIGEAENRTEQMRNAPCRNGVPCRNKKQINGNAYGQPSILHWDDKKKQQLSFGIEMGDGQEDGEIDKDCRDG